jgi:N-acetylneuraminate lyase
MSLLIHDPKRIRFYGLYPATFTPFDSQGQLNADAIEAYVQYLVEKTPVQGAFINGTSGESMNLSVKERKIIAEKWIQAVKKFAHIRKIRAIIHIGTACIEDSKELAAHAESIGADGFACMAPFFFKPKTVDALVDFCAQVAAAAPNTPFMYYHFPEITGVSIPAYKFFRLAISSKKIPNLVGGKYTSLDMVDLRRCLLIENGSLDILNGYETTLLAAISLGCKAAIGISFSLYSPTVQSIVELLSSDTPTAETLQQARQHQDAIISIFEAVEKYDAGMIPCFKVIMKHFAKLDFGPVRTPQRNLTEQETNELIAAVQNLLL